MSAETSVAARRGSIKYDLLAALSAQALRPPEEGGPKISERLALRLIALVTARYNWARDELSMGRAEMARMWGVDERTVKRELARLKATGFLVVKRPGVRGRVTVYGLGIDAIRAGTAEGAAALGPDFTERLSDPAGQGGETNVLRFPSSKDAGAETPQTGAPERWTRLRAALKARNPHRYESWFRQLTAQVDGDDGLILRAPSGFHAAYVSREFPGDLRAAMLEAGLRPGPVRIEGP